MESSTAPYISPLVAPTNAQPATESFGTTWQEVVTRVEGFCFHASDRLRGIQNYTHEERRTSLECYVANGSHRLFILYPGEFITKVEVASTDTIVSGVRIFTSKRVTPWFGCRATTRTTFQATDGFCINAFRGSCGSAGCTQLGVVYVPLEVAQEGHTLTVPGDSSAMHFVTHDRTADLALRTCYAAPCAIVVNVLEDKSNGGIRVVSRAEYERYVRFDGPLYHDPSEHWVVLADEERILSVHLGAVDGRCSTVLFETNIQTTSSFGCPSTGVKQKKRFACSGKSIGGFGVLSKGELRGPHTIVGVGVVYCADPAQSPADVANGHAAVVQPSAAA